MYACHLLRRTDGARGKREQSNRARGKRGGRASRARAGAENVSISPEEFNAQVTKSNHEHAGSVLLGEADEEDEAVNAAGKRDEQLAAGAMASLSFV